MPARQRGHTREVSRRQDPGAHAAQCGLDVAEVNRMAPQKSDEKLSRDDDKNSADNMTDFLSNEERGMEQFYETIKKASVK